MSSLAVCPGSFDPITIGHLNIISRAAKLFDKVIVVVMINSRKSDGMFTPEERMDFIRRSTGRDNKSLASFAEAIRKLLEKYDF